MKLQLYEVLLILQKEIDWCLDNPDKDLTKEQQIGFMNGLRQASNLIRLAEDLVNNDPPPPFRGLDGANISAMRYILDKLQQAKP